MITTRNKFITGTVAIAIMMTAIMTGCKKEAVIPASTTYQLKVKDQLGVSGTVTFTETSSTVTTISIALTGADAESHPAHIHINSAVESGAIALTLTPVVGGTSVTTVTTLDNASAISYRQLLLFDGYINVHQSSSNLGLILAQGDIGGNLLTDTSRTYLLDTMAAFGVSGIALFQKRLNGNTFVSISLNGTLAGDKNPAAIHLGSVATVGGGPVVKTLNDVDGTTGKSYSNIRALDSGTPISFDDLLVYDGYLAVHQSTTLMAVVLCQGNIGTH